MKVFLIDAYTRGDGIVLWFIDKRGKRRAFIQKINPVFFINRKVDDFDYINKELFSKFNKYIFVDSVKRRDIDGNVLDVWRVVCKDPATLKRIFFYCGKTEIFQRYDVFNIDLDPCEMFFYSENIFPFSWCDIDIFENDVLVKSCDKKDSIDYLIPDIKKIFIEPYCNTNPLQMNYLPDLKVKTDSKEEFIVKSNDFDFFRNILKKEDPDILICSYGDSYIIDLFNRNNVYGLNRGERKINKRKERSFVSYGKTVYKSGGVFLRGRIHIDPVNSFFYKETGLQGIIEMCRISGMSVQRVARTSPGTVITALETADAYKKGILIPYRKSRPERFKSAKKLIDTDKGGLSFRPVPGVFENVAELDFFSMYPSIMVNYNLSYETLWCSHDECKEKLPGTGYSVCTKQKGIIPCSLGFVLERRRVYKRLLKENIESLLYNIYDQRQIALKWLLVVSFGYLGYKNARFGRVESHEATTAIGRELLLKAKDVSEKYGFRVLHALTDAVWVYKKDASREDYSKLAENINFEVNEEFKGIFNNNGFEIVLDNIFKWIKFIPSVEDGVGVANRFFGFSHSGDFKIRGIELRRADCPGYIRMFQLEVLNVLKEASNVNEYIEKLKCLDVIIKKYIDMLKGGEFSAYELAIKKRLSKFPSEYKVNTDISCAAKTLESNGFKIRPGQKVRFIYVKKKSVKSVPLEVFVKDPKPIDVEKYVELLKRAVRGFEV